MTLKVTNFQNASGTRTFATCKAGLKFGSLSDNIDIVNSYNISSVVWLQQGAFEVKFETGTFPDGKYAIITSFNADQTGRDGELVLHLSAATGTTEVPPTASSMRFTIFDMGDNDYDPDAETSLLFFR
jgi:hypothetical protein